MEPCGRIVLDPAPRFAFRCKRIGDSFRLAIGYRDSDVIAATDPPRLNVEDHFRLALALCLERIKHVHHIDGAFLTLRLGDTPPEVATSN